MKIQWLGHACFLLKGSRDVVIDPFVPSGEVPASPDIVAVTHGHADHLGAAVEIGKPTVAMNEIAKYLDARGVPTEGMNIGGTVEVDGVSFTMTPALHSSWLEEAGEGYYGGVAAGFVVRMDGVTVYHAGDTGLFSDMKLVRELYRPEVALLPVGGRYTMGPREAMMAAEFVGAKTVIPMHYNTWPPIAQDLSEFKAAIERTTDIKVALLAPGESIEV
ncbi:L-ascorbate metabolism protein UlaG (beta-lactamase superfamily) [Methanofollis sp. W23]|uniref:metal-dependent hydrolase n=1 Tax=Methanofollis sp. W23 TaxID=2817849 RepID=UPI001AE30149|nr:metal-dependent hydrolase [Methanofollis sp. W23]MBP2145826.1 L-ascorbate metabolism protein UlaG (beta-lactamase superfamily) [Methanofollis sp. W23]